MRQLLKALPLLLAASVAADLSPATAAGLAGAPPPFDHGRVKVALVSLISQGDFFQAYQVGALRQARALGIDLRLFPGRGDPAAERDAIQQAINLGVKGLIIDHGMPATLRDIATQAVAAGIKVVAFDVNLDNPAIPQIEQSDHDLATLVLGQALKDNGDSFKAGLIYVAGFAPLDRRYAVWQAVKAGHPAIEQVARWGTAQSPVATAIADQSTAVFRAHPEISVVFAPWDEFARGASLAVDENRLQGKIRIYSADISTPDITAMREPGSAWVATAATNPAVVGAVSVRTAALLLAGENPGHEILVQPALVTRDFLLKEDIKTVQDLEKKLPAFAQSPAATATWMPDH
ncbi:MAG TPA: substrate-binding domain-containing protein [Acidisoma sp.]|jgi:simple sugar transport system substrate-binding protein|uniref:substrate-binding domain-containing protein n=1 Tax=Acidisoma sp. TaxID=1872115 RepID=UPI002B614203|nr:substrate-binding domain-containing protein [Acidisoma sp.]HTI03498.1 substrate-binding domain-containing protein [Acidisoma sp.]